MEQPQTPEKSANWVRPNIQNERSEIERTLSEFVGLDPTYVDVERVIEVIQTAPMVDLTDEEWEKLGNTDSFHNVRPDHIEDVQEITEEYNQDVDRGNPRSVAALLDGFC
jgi:hypothetical protein